jgi:hypothetical protein
MKVYFHDNLDTDQRLPHEGEPATLNDLEALGVFASNIPDQAEVDRIAEARGYRNRDEVLPCITRWQMATEMRYLVSVLSSRLKYPQRLWARSTPP